MKKVTLWLCMGMMVLGLTACGTGDGEQKQGSAVESGVESTENTKAGAEADEITGMSGAKGEASGAGSTDDKGSSTQDGTGGGKPFGENADGTFTWSEEMKALKTVIVDTLGAENYYPDMPIDAEKLEDTFGITPDMYDDYLAEMPMIGTNADTLLIIKAKDDKVEAVQEAMYVYRDAKVSETVQDSMNIGKVQASRIETNGNYVSFVQLGGDTLAAQESGDEAVIEHCLQVNELVLEVIAQNMH